MISDPTTDNVSLSVIVKKNKKSKQQSFKSDRNFNN